MRTLSIITFILFLITAIQAQENKQLSPIIFIYDASGSMWGQIDGKSKMEIASTVLSDAVNKLPDNQQIGLVAYGHRTEGDCKDVEFLAEVAPGNKTQIHQSLKKIKPLGKTPLAYSATLVIDKLRQTKMKSTIILITDGIESCDGNICDVIKSAKEEGIDFRLHILGFGLKVGETEQLKCATEAGDGKYFDATDAGNLTAALSEATNETVDALIDNFSVFVVKNGKPIDAMVQSYKAGTSIASDGVRTYQDTGFMHLPAGKYDFKVTPLENSRVKPITITNIESFDDKIAHKTVSFDGAKFQISTLNNGEGWDAAVKVINKTDGQVAAHGRTYGRPKILEVNPGVYNIEILALVMQGIHIKQIIENMKVEAGDLKEVEHNFKTGIAMIGAVNSSGLVDASVNFLETTTNKNVAVSRTYTSESTNPRKFILNPGIYQVKVLSLGKSGGKTEIFNLEVKENETVKKMIQF
jgi:Ca-activated chloride channel family protein